MGFNLGLKGLTEDCTESCLIITKCIIGVTKKNITLYRATLPNIYTCTYIQTYIHIHIYTHTYVYTHTHTSTQHIRNSIHVCSVNLYRLAHRATYCNQRTVDYNLTICSTATLHEDVNIFYKHYFMHCMSNCRLQNAADRTSACQ